MIGVLIETTVLLLIAAAFVYVVLRHRMGWPPWWMWTLFALVVVNQVARFVGAHREAFNKASRRTQDDQWE